MTTKAELEQQLESLIQVLSHELRPYAIRRELERQRGIYDGALNDPQVIDTRKYTSADGHFSPDKTQAAFYADTIVPERLRTHAGVFADAWELHNTREMLRQTALALELICTTVELPETAEWFHVLRLRTNK